MIASPRPLAPSAAPSGTNDANGDPPLPPYQVSIGPSPRAPLLPTISGPSPAPFALAVTTPPAPPSTEAAPRRAAVAAVRQRAAPRTARIVANPVPPLTGWVRWRSCDPHRTVPD